MSECHAEFVVQAVDVHRGGIVASVEARNVPPETIAALTTPRVRDWMAREMAKDCMRRAQEQFDREARRMVATDAPIINHPIVGLFGSRTPAETALANAEMEFRQHRRAQELAARRRRR